MSEYLFQGARIIAPVTFESETVNFFNELIDLSEERFQLPGQRFTFSFNTEAGGHIAVWAHMAL